MPQPLPYEATRGHTFGKTFLSLDLRSSFLIIRFLFGVNVLQDTDKKSWLCVGDGRVCSCACCQRRAGWACGCCHNNQRLLCQWAIVTDLKKYLFTLKWGRALSPVLGTPGENMCNLFVCPSSLPHPSVHPPPRMTSQGVTSPALISIQRSTAASHHTRTGGYWACSQHKLWPAWRARH